MDTLEIENELNKIGQDIYEIKCALEKNNKIEAAKTVLANHYHFHGKEKQKDQSIRFILDVIEAD